MLPGQSGSLWQLKPGAQAGQGFYGGVLRTFRSMAAPRLTDSQKEELVARYREGETAQALAEAFGCSPNTVSRVLKAAIDPEELASIKKQQRGRSQGSDAAPAPDPVPVAVQAALDVVPQAATEDVVEALDSEPDATGLLAIDDADDFGDDGEDEGDDEADLPETLVAVAVTLDLPPADRPAVLPQPLTPGALPASVYMLVDKTVELQARPLREFPELGALPDDEQERQALMLYANPRQAKRQCGRSQRVIKVPDTGVLERTSSYLVAQGITRLVVEGGSLYAIPGG